jgi:hypothetical protein
LSKAENRLRELAAQEETNREAERQLADLQAQLAAVQAQLQTVSSNLALAKTPAQFEAVSVTFDQLKAQESDLGRRVSELESRAGQIPDAEAAVSAAMTAVRRLTELVSGQDGLKLAGEAFSLANARLFLRFQPVQVKKRLLNKVAGGVVVFGAAPDPIETYHGPTGRRGQNYNGSITLGEVEPGKPGPTSPPDNSIGSGLEEKSLRNVSRGERI